MDDEDEVTTADDRRLSTPPLALSRLAMPHPRLVAFLGVGFMLLVVLAFLSDNLFTSRTLVVVPVLTAVTFLLAHLIAGLLERADA
jgi:hypothetical protein